MTSFIAEEPVANEVVEPKQKSIPIEELNLETRANNGLKRNGILTVQQLLEKTKQEITEIKFLGKKSIREIIQRLKQQGYELKK
jgi:DNA-directed RNA polymerase subunit alpha